ncbi:MAG: hypothetical protein MJ252_06460 [archaeon]|nr:hypothetical protein [archaeon]
MKRANKHEEPEESLEIEINLPDEIKNIDLKNLNQQEKKNAFKIILSQFPLFLKEILRKKPKNCRVCGNPNFTLVCLRKAGKLFSPVYNCTKYICNKSFILKAQLPGVKDDVHLLFYFILFNLFYFVSNKNINYIISELNNKKVLFDIPINEGVESLKRFFRIISTKYMLEKFSRENFGQGKNYTYFFKKFKFINEKELNVCSLYDRDKNCLRFIILRKLGKFDISSAFINPEEITVEEPNELEKKYFKECFEEIEKLKESCYGELLEDYEHFLFYFYEILFKVHLDKKMKIEKLDIICNIMEEVFRENGDEEVILRGINIPMVENPYDIY